MSADPAGSEERSAPRPLAVPLLCWHESVFSARTDPLVALAEDGGFVATDRPPPVGTPVFLELALGHASNAARAQIDAVVVSGDAPVEMTGFVVRFVDVDDAVLTWIQRYLASSAPRRGAARPVEERPPAPPSRAPLADPSWTLPPTSGLNPFVVAEAAASAAVDEPAVAEAPVAEAPVAEAPVAEAPVAEAPVLEVSVAEPLVRPAAFDDAAVEDLPELSDFEEIGSDGFELAEVEEPAAEAAIPPAVHFEPPAEEPPAGPPTDAPEAAPDEAELPSLDAQVEEALGGFAAGGELDDAFDASFSPWVELDDADAPPLALEREPADASAQAAFDPFADADAPDAPLPQAAAPLASDEFLARPEPSSAVGDDTGFDDGWSEPEGSAPLPVAPGASGLAEAGAGFSDPFARAAAEARRQEAAVSELEATREVIPRSFPAAAVPPEPPPEPSPEPSPAPPPYAAPEAPAAPAAPLRKTTPEGLTPLFGTRPPSGIFHAPSPSSAAEPPPAPAPSPSTPWAAEEPSGATAEEPAVAGPVGAPEPPAITTAPYAVAPGPTLVPASAPSPVAAPPPRAPFGPPADEPPHFAATQRFGVAPGGPPLAPSPGGPPPSPAATPSEQTERYRLDAVPSASAAPPAPSLSPPVTPPAPAFRTPTLEFPQPGPAVPPAAPPEPRLPDLTAVNTPTSALAALEPPLSPAPPRSLGIPGFGPEEDVVEVSTTSQLVRESEGGLAALVAKDKAARLDMPVQSVTGGPTSVTVEPGGFRDPGPGGDPFADLDLRAPTPSPFAAAPAPPPASSGATPVAPRAPEVWFPGDPPRTPAQGPPTGVLGVPHERPVEAWQVTRGPLEPTGEPDELPLVTGVSVLEEDEELPLVPARTLDDDDTDAELFGEPWVVGGPGRGPKRS